MKQLDNQALAQLLAEQPTVQVVDVRSPMEYHMLGHIPGAVLMPLQQLPNLYTELSAELPTVVVCQHGVRSVHAAEFLTGQGFTQLYNLEAGMAEWDGAVEDGKTSAQSP
ncbi:MAG: rhodanese-like domain-containing protein [Candidatus Melainabacteria bacterium]|nr:rhodanese-like domain-containing protein [Candidatus Melainabacteria bacterium]